MPTSLIIILTLAFILGTVFILNRKKKKANYGDAPLQNVF